MPKRSAAKKRKSPIARRWRAARRALRRLPPGLRYFLIWAALAALCVAVNWIYQVVRKPSELFFPVSGALYKTPAETWDTYSPLFRKHATRVITPALLAALAQVEGSGNPVARTYWRWALRPTPFEVYRPASSAVGMYQITDGTFALARRLCIHNHRVVQEGAWNDPHSCWLNGLYVRVIPSHAVELTAAYLDYSVAQILTTPSRRPATLRQQQALATIIHLCGAGAGSAYAERGFHLLAHQYCGDHDAAEYLRRVDMMVTRFAAMQ
jgi:hypothetical protein